MGPGRCPQSARRSRRTSRINSSPRSIRPWRRWTGRPPLSTRSWKKSRALPQPVIQHADRRHTCRRRLSTGPQGTHGPRSDLDGRPRHGGSESDEFASRAWTCGREKWRKPEFREPSTPAWRRSPWLPRGFGPCERRGPPISGTKVTWLAPNVLLATILPPHAPRPTIYAPRASIRRNQRGQVVRRPSSTGYCLTPTADLSKTERGPTSTNGPSILSMSTNQAIPAEKSNRSSLLAAVGPLTTLSWPEALNASRSKRACRMAIRRNACSLLALPDFPKFAQAVRYGVPGTPELLEIGRSGSSQR